MTLLGLIIALAVIAIVGYAAFLLITKFFSAPFQVPALAIVGVILLIVLLANFFPEAGNYRIWR